jgi:endonuclease/exonuclease/phosphatase family metal-dependent hydrolase
MPADTLEARLEADTFTSASAAAFCGRALRLLAASSLACALIACGGADADDASAGDAGAGATTGPAADAADGSDDGSGAGGVPDDIETPSSMEGDDGAAEEGVYLGGGYEGVLRAGVTEVPERAPGTLRLATYNVLNLFDDEDDPELTGDNDDMHDRWDGLRAKPEPQLQAVADAIRAIDADVIGLQEIESEQALLWFRDSYLADMGYTHHISKDVEHSRGIEQAVLSRFPIVEYETWPRKPLGARHPSDPSLLQRGERDKAGQEIVFRRSPLFTMIEVPAASDDPATAESTEPYRLGLLVIHHKSGRQNDYWRQAEANVVVQLARQKLDDHPEMNLAILGDFNAQPDEVSVTTYADQIGMIDTLADRLAGDTSFITHASGRAIDFILVNENLNAEVVPGSAFVFATPLRPEEYDWRSTPPPTGYASDHMPVVVDIHIGDR